MAKVAEIAGSAAQKIIEAMGFEMADVEYVRENGQMCLNFYICREQGVTIDDCEAVSRAIDAAVDTADPTGGTPYCLCVSTWGDRPLKNDRDFARNLGKEVELKLKKPDSGKKKKFTGILKTFDEETVAIENSSGTMSVKRNNLECIRPYIGF